MTQTLTLISGIVCITSAFFMLYILKLDYERKRHVLRMFQLGFFAILLAVGTLQLMSLVIQSTTGLMPWYYENLYSVMFVFICLLVIPYFRYHKRKHNLHNSH